MPERTERVQQLVMRELSSLGPNHSPNAFGVSANGNVAVGYSGPSPVRWVGNGAAQDLLLEALGIDTTGWDFEVLAGISGDGTTLVGPGRYLGQEAGPSCACLARATAGTARCTTTATTAITHRTVRTGATKGAERRRACRSFA